MREKSVCESDEGCEVRGHLLKKQRQLYRRWRGEVEKALLAGVEEDGVNCGILLDSAEIVVSKQSVDERGENLLLSKSWQAV